MTKTRCEWPGSNELMIAYHDDEWGVPLHDDNRHFEFLVLDGAQAGLSWQTVINKRENYRKAFDQFDVKKVARYTEQKIEKLMNDPGIIRNRLKITGAVTSARAFIAVQEEFGSFDNYIWQFVGGKPIIHHRQTIRDIPATSPESDAMSKDMKRRGFKFCGSTICYAYMQAAGMVNDHTVDCFRWKAVQKILK